MQISVVVPLLNEDESLRELEAWIRRVMEEHKFTYEILFVDDGSTDTSWAVIRELQQKNPAVRGIKFRRNYGKSAALNEGFAATRGDVVITMDADLQDSPDEIPGLYKMIADDGFDLVSGWKQKRYDPLSKNIPSKFFNGVTRKISKIPLHDFNCGLKAYRGEVVKHIEVYGEMHRYIPLIAKWAGFGKIGERVVQHQARKFGETKFGLDRFVNGALDLISIMFVGKFGKRPMHFFGVVGGLMILLSLGSAFYIAGNKIYRLSAKLPTILVTDNPWFYIALTGLILGTMLFLAGFLGELVSRNSPSRNTYVVEERI